MLLPFALGKTLGYEYVERFPWSKCCKLLLDDCANNFRFRFFGRLIIIVITAKVFHGYNAGKAYEGIDEAALKKTKGRDYNYNELAKKTKTEIVSTIIKE